MHQIKAKGLLFRFLLVWYAVDPYSTTYERLAKSRPESLHNKDDQRAVLLASLTASKPADKKQEFFPIYPENLEFGAIEAYDVRRETNI